MKKLTLLLFLAISLASCTKENSTPKEVPKVINDQAIDWNTSSIEVDNLDFGVVDSSSNKLITINVINDSPATLTGEPSLSNSNFSILSSNCQDLVPGKSCTIKVSFDARNKIDSLYTANIIFGDALNLIQAEINHAQIVQEIAFFNRTAPLSSLSLGTINYNNSLIKSILIKNQGNTTVNDSLHLSNTDASIVYDTCSNKNLEPNKNCQFKFFITGRGKSGPVNTTITYGAKTLTLNTSVKPFETVAEESSQIVLIYNNVNHNQSPLDLGTLNLGTLNDFKFVYKNTGDGAGRISSINLDSIFQIFQNTCSGQILSPNQTCIVRTKLTTQAKGTFNALIAADVEYAINSQSIQWLVRSPGDKISCTSQIDNAQLANITWSGATYSNCLIESCLLGYHIQDNACILETCPSDKVKTSDNLECVYKIASGGTVTTSGNYKIHTFYSSSSFTVTAEAATSGYEIMVVAGGGGSAGYISSGAGGGGVIYNYNFSIPIGTHTATIGQGGGEKQNGFNSVLYTQTAIGGGTGAAAGGANNGPPTSGGSGGGGTISYGAGAGTPGQGFAGGSGVASYPYYGQGGGGGGGGGGGNGSAGGGGGAGGIGFLNPIDGQRYAGGGGGGSCDGARGPGGAGGGGISGQISCANGSSHANPGAGTPNTGGGAGGGSASGSPGSASGGSGIIMIKYLYK